MVKKQRRASNEAQDGGMFALAGFVNQMLGSAEDFVRCVSPPKPSQTLISFETEAWGQDTSMTATFKGKRTRVLTQYKFSLNPTKYPIGPKEFKTIAAALRKSEAECNRSKKLPTQKILRSNRLLSPRAESSRILTEIKFEKYDPAKARRTLQSHAARFGILEPDELHRGIQQVIGELAVTSASPGSHRLTREGFDKALTGYHHPQSIFVNDAAARLQQELERQRESRLALEGSHLVDRVVVEDAMAEWTNDALVVFTGGGGLGKTTALWQVLRAGVDEASSPRRLAALITAEAEMPASFSDLVDQWRGAAPTMSPDVELRSSVGTADDNGAGNLHSNPGQPGEIRWEDRGSHDWFPQQWHQTTLQPEIGIQ
ncbi:MAG: hypothetical protein ACLPWF_22195 [Bryobacteraceae bacterium]